MFFLQDKVDYNALKYTKVIRAYNFNYRQLKTTTYIRCLGGVHPPKQHILTVQDL